jgi:hypothetical protein
VYFSAALLRRDGTIGVLHLLRGRERQYIVHVSAKVPSKSTANTAATRANEQ